MAPNILIYRALHTKIVLFASDIVWQVPNETTDYFSMPARRKIRNPSVPHDTFPSPA
jgi:hypothetical protein